MQKYYRLRLSRPFDIWKYSKNDGNGNLTKIVFAYDFDSADCLVGQLGNIFATKRLFEALDAGVYSGYKLIPVITRYSDAYEGSRELEPVMRLEITGTAGVDDFGLQNPVTLVVSDKVRTLLLKHGIEHTEIHDYNPGYKVPTLDSLFGDDPKE